MDIFDGRHVKIQLEGRGGFAEVWKVYDMLANSIQALKIFGPSSGIGVDGIKMLAREYSIMNLVHHENLLTPENFSIYDNKVPYLVLRYCHRGNIQKLAGMIEEKEAWQIFSDMAKALEYLHSMRLPIIHQDIKPANILYDDSGNCVLTDFGVSTKYKQAIRTLTNGESTFKQAGSQAYMAPERFTRNNRPIFANDTYSLGVTMFELLSDYLPFGDKGGLLQIEGVVVPELPGDYSPLLKSTIESCMDPTPSKRPLLSKIIELASASLSRYPSGRVVYDDGGESYSYYEKFQYFSIGEYQKKRYVSEQEPGYQEESFSHVNMRPTVPLFPNQANDLPEKEPQAPVKKKPIELVIKFVEKEKPVLKPVETESSQDKEPFYRPSENADWLYQNQEQKQEQKEKASNEIVTGCLIVVILIAIICFIIPMVK